MKGQTLTQNYNDFRIFVKVNEGDENIIAWFYDETAELREVDAENVEEAFSLAQALIDEITGEIVPSKNHYGLIGKFEYYLRDGELYRANVDNPVMPDGYRAGGRWQCPQHMAESWMAMIEEFSPGEQI